MTTDPHADLDVLADVLVGEASPAQAEHVAACASCSAALAALEAAMTPLTADLSALAAADPGEPADLQARLEAALAGERAQAPAPTAPPTATVTPIGQARSRRWLVAGSGVAAAAALVLGGVLLAGGSSSDDADTSASGAGSTGIATSTTGSDYGKDGVLLKEQLPALLAGGAVPPAADARTMTAPAPESAGGGPAGATTQTLADPLAALRDPATLAGCLAGLTDPGDDSLPLALDYASFAGQPALVVVLPTTKPGKVDVFVVGAGCTTADAKLLFFTRLDAPS